MKPWSDKRLLAAAKKIDDLNTRVEKIINSIESSGHAVSDEVVGSLKELVMLDSAQVIVEDALRSSRSSPSSESPTNE